MPRKATGTIIAKRRTDGGITYAGRFTAGGRKVYRVLGDSAEGYTREQAEERLAYLVAQAKHGDYRHPEPEAVPAVPDGVPLFDAFAHEWYAEGAADWKPSTADAYRYQLDGHLRPFFGDHPLDRITVAEVDRYRNHKLAALESGAEGAIGRTYINKTITTLGSIMELAMERDLIGKNPVRINPRRRRVTLRAEDRPHRRFLDSAEQIAALLDAAGEMDRELVGDLRSRSTMSRRCLLAVLVFSGMRIGEALALRWRDVDLSAVRIRVPGTKTAAAVREQRMLPPLAAELRAHKARTGAGADDLVFATRQGTPFAANNTRRRYLQPAIVRANARLAREGHAQIPLGEGRGNSLTQHDLRHTYATVRAALGHPAADIAHDGGWDDLGTLARTYTHAMSLSDSQRAALRALVEGSAPALNGHPGTLGVSEGVAA